MTTEQQAMSPEQRQMEKALTDAYERNLFEGLDETLLKDTLPFLFHKSTLAHIEALMFAKEENFFKGLEGDFLAGTIQLLGTVSNHEKIYWFVEARKADFFEGLSDRFIVDLLVTLNEKNSSRQEIKALIVAKSSNLFRSWRATIYCCLLRG